MKGGELAAIEALHQMERALLEMNAEVHAFSVAGKPWSATRYQESRIRWEMFLGQYPRFTLDRRQLRLFQSLERVSQVWIRQADQIIVRGQGQKTEPPDLDPVRESYNQLLRVQKVQLERNFAQALRSLERGSSLALVLRGGACAVGLLTSLMVIRRFRKALDCLNRAVLQVSEGQHEPMGCKSSDEFGVIIKAFNQMNYAVRERVRALEEQKKGFIQASEHKSEFLANTSHELRTPLNTIMGYSQLILEGQARSKEEEKSYLVTIQQSARQLLSRLTDVLEIARMESGKLKLDLEPVLVRQVFANVESQMKASAAQKGLKWCVDVEGTDLRALAHPERLTQVVMKMVENAIKFTSKGEVQMGGKVEGGRVVLIVRDSGVGISIDKQQRFFKKLVQGDGSVQQAYCGTGLGLAYSRTVLMLMNGTLDVQSEGEDRGVTVRMVLPGISEGPKTGSNPVGE